MKKYLYILVFCLLQCSLTGFAQSEDTSISDTITLPEVTISAERPYVQRKADRMIVGIEHSKLLKARSLSNILNLIPGISYDGEGGVTFMGNAVKIYENGRMLKLTGAQLKRYLSSLRGNDIENLEILSHATAEYDAEGGSGILVINRRRRHEYGLSGYVGSEYERKSSNSFSEFAGLTYSWGNFAFYANMTLGQSESHSKIKESDFGQDLTVRSISESTDKGLYYMPKLGFDFYISPSQYLGVEWSGNYSKDYSDDGRIHSTVTDQSSCQTNIQTYAPYTFKPRNNNATLNYEWKIDTLGSKLSVIADYAGSGERDLCEFENRYISDISGDSIISKSQPTYERIDIYSGKVDFAKCFSRHQFNVGAKYSYVGIHYNSRMLLGNTVLGGMLSEDMDQRDDFNYDEQQYAVYGMYRYTARNWDVQVGLRNEYTKWETRQLVKEKLHNNRHENNLFPSFFLRRDMGKGNALSFAYSQAINSPSYEMVNPFVFHLSETSTKEGNPDLIGELIYDAALQFVLKSRYIFSLSAVYIDRKFNEIYEQIGERQTRYMFINDGTSMRLGLYTEIPFTWGIWDSRNFAYISQNYYQNSTKRVDDFGVSISSLNRFRVSEKFSLMANLRYIKSNRQLYLIPKTDYWGVDIEGDFTCFKDKLNINFGVKDLLNTRGKSKWVFENGDFEHHTEFDHLSRKFFISVTYSFSAGTKRASQRDKMYSNEEEKGRM